MQDLTPRQESLMTANVNRPLSCLALFVALAVTLGLAPPQAPGASRHIVLISLDGFPSWALDDPYLPVPTLRRLAARGAVASGMRPVNPTVTWPNHTTLITGVTPAKHGVLFNGLLRRDPGVPPVVEPWLPRDQMVRVKTVYDVAHARGLTTAQVDWVAIQAAPTVTWEFPERPAPDGRIAQELVKAGVLSQAELETFATRNIIWRDHVWTEAAAHIIREHKPNLMMYHLLNLDSTQHRYGPRTPAAMTTMAHLDAQVAEIVAAVDRAGLTSRTTFFVVSDHGFKLVKRQIRLNAAFLQAGLLTVEDGKPDGKPTVRIVQSDAYVVPEGGSAIVYLTAPDPGGDILARVRKAMAGIEGIDAVIEPADYGRYGLPLPSVNDQMGVLFVTPKDGYAFTAAADGEVVVNATEGSLGAHGYPSTDPDLSALFIACGAGITPGVKLDVIDNVDVAPTMAELLGLTLENVDGRVLKEILSRRR
jgi:predicted AlkP superfamily pyrophosphatase or phosphodiesterase